MSLRYFAVRVGPRSFLSSIRPNPNSTPIVSHLYQQHQTMATSSKSKLVRVNTLDAPGAIGPYSQGVAANGFLYVSGSLGFVPNTGEFISSTDVSSQTKQALENMGAVLKAGKSDFDRVVKTTILLADMADFPKVNSVYASFFKQGQFPARACYAVKTLPKNALVEIEAIATHD